MAPSPPPPPASRDRAPSWTRLPTPEERAAELADAERATRREGRIDNLWAAAIVLACLAGGLFAIGWSAHTTDAGMGEIVFLAGVLAANIGILAAWVWRFRRARERGEL